MTAHIFWRDDALPFIEARWVRDGRGVCYAPHLHETFSIGAILEGRCSYTNRHKLQEIDAGTIVLMNPGDVHACNPIRDEPWAYRMLYLDKAWVARIQHEASGSAGPFLPFAATAIRNDGLFQALNHLYETLVDPAINWVLKEQCAHEFTALVQRSLGTKVIDSGRANAAIVRAAEFIRVNCSRSIKLKEIAAAAELSPSYFIRAFKAEFGMSPHAYLINCRIELSRQQIRRGRPLAEVAAAAGFSDQAHLQRSFKKVVAVTPGKYQR